jgi:ubiquinone/menaquinone biosynthesis C-methylase UbiE
MGSRRRQSLEQITHRYDRLARFYNMLEPLYLIHDGARRKAVEALDLSPGETVLEIGCGTGRNLEHLLNAVSGHGSVIGLDASPGMLAEAGKLVEQRGWSNVRLLEGDAARLSIEDEVDAVLFSLSYSVLPDRRPALEAAWHQLRAGGRLVVMDVGLPDTLLGRIFRPAARLLVRIAPGDAYSRPWEDLATLAPVSSQRFLAGLYFVCSITKPLMARTVDLQGVRELLERGAQLVEVLPAQEYEELHLPAAISLPLKELDAHAAERLDRERPVIVYCWDALCDMSPRAAAWLEQLGFDAYDYALSKVDWMAHGLPMEGTGAGRPTAGSFLRDDVAICTLETPAEEIKQRIDSSPYGYALVLAERVVLGRVRRSRLQDAAVDARAAQLMEPGPSTSRPHIAPGEIAAQLKRAGTSSTILTTPEGELLGIVRASDLPHET